MEVNKRKVIYFEISILLLSEHVFEKFAFESLEPEKSFYFLVNI